MTPPRRGRPAPRSVVSTSPFVTPAASGSAGQPLAVSTETVRRTVDVPWSRNVQVDRWMLDASERLHQKVTVNALINTMLHLLVTDELLAGRVLSSPELRVDRRRKA